MKILSAIALCAVLPAFAQEGEHDQAAMEQAWAAFAQVSDIHTEMAQWVGNFDVTSKHWMAPGTEPMVTQGKMVNTLAMGGRYLISNHTGSFMGQPFEGLNIQAYDNARKAYYSTWIDNMGTGILLTEGNLDESGDLVMTGTMSSPMGDIKVREVIKFVGPDKQIFEMYMDMGGQEMKAMEAVMTRSK